MLQPNHIQHYPIGGENALRCRLNRPGRPNVVRYIPSNEIYKIVNMTIRYDMSCMVDLAIGSVCYDHPEINEISLLLRPKSDILKDQEILNEMSDLQIEAFKAFGNIDNLPFGAIKKCFEKHIDVWDLLEKGLAIDINTVEI